MKRNKLWMILSLVVALCMLTAGIAFGNEEKVLNISEDEINAILNTTTDASQVTSPFIEVSNSVRGSVVGINNYRMVTTSSGYGFGWGNRQQETTERLYATGSGVVITGYGHVLTNHHVIEDADRVTVTVDGDDKEYEATVVGYDADKDVAVLYAPELDIVPVVLGDSDALQVGEWAIVIGNPLGEEFARTVTVGVISALDREVTDSTYDRYGRRTSITNTMIQVDAAINSGNSGGGMFNVLGQLMGIPERKYTSGNSFFSNTADVDNIGMCIPINVAKPLIEEVLRGFDGTTASANHADATASNDTMLNKPRLGVNVYTLSSSTTEKLPLGALVSKVEEESPAEQAGIQVGDVIVAIDGTVCSSANAMIEKLQEYKEGDTISVTVYRAEGMEAFLDNYDLSAVGEGEYLDLNVTLRIIDHVES